MADEMEYELRDARLRLAHRTFWLPGEGDPADPHRGYMHRMIWAVDGIAGSLGFVVDMGGFRSGHDDDQRRELLLSSRSPDYVQAGLAVRGIHAHAARPWLHLAEDAQDHDPECPLLDGRECWSHQVMYEHEPQLHKLLVQLVQPGGPEYVWERLEELYRKTFDARPSAQAERRRTQQEATLLAEARAEGAARAAGEAVQAAQDMDAETELRTFVARTSAQDPAQAESEHMTHPDDAKQVHDMVDVLYSQGKGAHEIYEAVGAYLGHSR